MGIPPISIMGLGLRWDSSEILVPNPPAKMTTCICVILPSFTVLSFFYRFYRFSFFWFSFFKAKQLLSVDATHHTILSYHNLPNLSIGCSNLFKTFAKIPRIFYKKRAFSTGSSCCTSHSSEGFFRAEAPRYNSSSSAEGEYSSLS